MITEEKLEHSIVLVLLGSIVLVVIVTGYIFIIKRDYSFIIESSCDPTSQTCFHRDCSNPDDCPPNGLSNYQIYEVKAVDFPRCSDNSCPECQMKSISCISVACDSEVGDECIGPII